MARATPVPSLMLSLMGLAALAGCTSLSDAGGTFEGAIIDGNFVRRCFAPETRATLVFNPEDAVAVTEIPPPVNVLSTTDGTFDQTPLIPSTALPNDQLSAFDFPGPKRLRNFLLMASPEAGPLANRDAIVVVSLLENGSVEVRVWGRTADDAPPCPVSDTEDDEASDEYVTDPHEYFGVFQLSH